MESLRGHVVFCFLVRVHILLIMCAHLENVFMKYYCTRNILPAHSFIKPEGQEGAISTRQLVATFICSFFMSFYVYFSLGMHYGDILSTFASQGIVITLCWVRRPHNWSILSARFTEFESTFHYFVRSAWTREKKNPMWPLRGSIKINRAVCSIFGLWRLTKKQCLVWAFCHISHVCSQKIGKKKKLINVHFQPLLLREY